MQCIIKNLISDESAQGLVEYSFALALVALIAVVALSLMGGSIQNFFNTSKNELSGVKTTISNIAETN